jgi:hypothetical protein
LFTVAALAGSNTNSSSSSTTSHNSNQAAAAHLVLQERYKSMVQSGVLKPEAQQKELVMQLSALLQQLQDYTAALACYKEERLAYEVSGLLVQRAVGAAT